MMVRAEPISVDEIVVKDGDTIHARGAEFRLAVALCFDDTMESAVEELA